MNLPEKSDLSIEEFLDYLIEEDKNKPSDSEIILNYGKGIDEINSEMGDFQDKLMFLIHKNNIQINNKVEFILDICSRENKDELIPLIACFICDNEYINTLKSKNKSSINKGSLAKYILLKQDIDDFINKLNFIKSCEKDYKSFTKEIIKDEIQLGEEITDESRKILLQLFNQYVKKTGMDSPSNENLEYIHKFCTANEKRKSIYPFLIFKIFTSYKSKISNNDLSITPKRLLKYVQYNIDNDNGKNFNTHENYINLFFELCDMSMEMCNINLNIYIFEKCSNIANWYIKNSDETEPFSYSIDSLVKSKYGIYNSMFFEESSFWRDDFDERGIFNKENKKTISEEEYLNEYINEHLENINTYGQTYLKEMARGKRYGNLYVKKITKKILKFEDETLIQDKEFINHFYYVLEGVFKEIGDEKVNEIIIDYLNSL